MVILRTHLFVYKNLVIRNWVTESKKFLNFYNTHSITSQKHSQIIFSLGSCFQKRIMLFKDFLKKLYISILLSPNINSEIF